jgi:hypothetical protein
LTSRTLGHPQQNFFRADSGEVEVMLHAALSWAPCAIRYPRRRFSPNASTDAAVYAGPLEHPAFRRGRTLLPRAWWAALNVAAKA